MGIFILYEGLIVTIGFIVAIFSWSEFFDGYSDYSILEGIILPIFKIHNIFSSDINTAGMIIIHSVIIVIIWPAIIFNCIVIGGYGLSMVIWRKFRIIFAKNKQKEIIK